MMLARGPVVVGPVVQDRRRRGE